MARTIVLLEDTTQLRALDGAQQGARDDFLLVACDNAVAASLEKRGLQFIDETAMLDSKVASDNALRAPRLADEWAVASRAAAQEQGFGALPDFSGDISWPIEICLNAAHLYDRIFDDGEIGAVELCDAPPRAMLRTGPAPAYLPASGLIRAVVRFVAEKRGIPVRRVPQAEGANWNARPWRPRVAVSERNVRGDDSCTIPGNDSPVAILWRDGLWEREILEMRAILTGDFGWRVLELAPADLEVLSVLEGPAMQTDRTSFVHRFSGILRETAPREGAHPGLFASESLAFQRTAIAHEVYRSLQLRSVFASIVNGLRPPVVVFGHDAFTVERALQDACLAAGVPTVSLAHSGVMPLAGYIGLVGAADVTCVWNAGDRERLERVGSGSTRFAETGSLRFDRRAVPESGQPAVVPGQVRRIVLLTSPTHVRSSFPTTSDGAYRDAWSEIARLAREHGDWEFVIRPHPAFDQMEYYAAVVRDSGDRITISPSGPIEQVLDGAEAAVLVNYCSTAAIDALIAGVPLFFLTSALRDSPLLEDPLRSAGGIEVLSVSDLERAIAELFNSPAAAARARQRGRSVLAKHLGASDHPARARVRRVLQSLVSEPLDAALPLGKGSGLSAVAGVVDLGSRAVSAAAFRRLADDLVSGAHAPFGGQRDARRFTRTAYVFAMRKRLEQKRWEEAAELAFHALVSDPAAVLRPEYWRVAGKCLVMRRALTHRAANTLDRWLSRFRTVAARRPGRRLFSRQALPSSNPHAAI